MCVAKMRRHHFAVRFDVAQNCQAQRKYPRLRRPRATATGTVEKPASAFNADRRERTVRKFFQFVIGALIVGGASFAGNAYMTWLVEVAPQAPDPSTGEIWRVALHHSMVRYVTFWPYVEYRAMPFVVIAVLLWSGLSYLLKNSKKETED